MVYKTERHWEIGTKMNLIFYCFVAVVSSRTLEPAESDDFESKLNQYQAATGIDDDKRNEIWNTTMKNCTYFHFKNQKLSDITVDPFQALIRFYFSTSSGFPKL